jgi:hypothetical protein
VLSVAAALSLGFWFAEAFWSAVAFWSEVAGVLVLAAVSGVLVAADGAGVLEAAVLDWSGVLLAVALLLVAGVEDVAGVLAAVLLDWFMSEEVPDVDGLELAELLEAAGAEPAADISEVLLGVLLVELALLVDVCGGAEVVPEPFAALGWLAPVVPVLLAAPALQLAESICTFPTFRLLSPELVPEMETSCPT